MKNGSDGKRHIIAHKNFCANTKWKNGSDAKNSADAESKSRERGLHRKSITIAVRIWCSKKLRQYSLWCRDEPENGSVAEMSCRNEKNAPIQRLFWSAVTGYRFAVRRRNTQKAATIRRTPKNCANAEKKNGSDAIDAAAAPVSCSIILILKHLTKKRADSESKNGSDAETKK